MSEFKVPSIVYWIAAPFLLVTLAIERRKGVFKNVEKFLIDALVKASPEDFSIALCSQLGEINHALRVTAKFSETNLYRITGIRPSYERSQLLPVALGTLCFAKVRMLVKGASFVVTFYAVDARFFSIEFDGDVRRYYSCQQDDCVLSDWEINF
jgi:hypothetical protein